ncbi:MAG: hypothetical protein KKH98_03035, partial [Spirochaetes bacterium]|nr:hypothetical protein [Spirochaetota bacterium]
DKRSALKLAGMNALLFFTALIRKAGFLYVGAIPFMQLLKKKWKELIISIITLVLILFIYLGYQSRLKQANKELIAQNKTVDIRIDRSVINEFTYLIEHIKKKAPTILKNTPLVYAQKLLGNPFAVYNRNTNLLHYLIFIILITGVIMSLKKEIKIFDLHFVFLAGSFLFFSHFDPIVYARHTAIIFPFIYFYILKGTGFYLSKLKIKEQSITSIKVLLCTVFILINMNSVSSFVVAAKSGFHPLFKDFISACKWIDTNTPKDSAIASRKSTLAYAWAGNKTSIHYFSQKGGATRYSAWSKKLEYNTLKMYYDDNINYLILDSFSPDAYQKVLPIIQHAPNAFQVIHRLGSNNRFTYILQIRKDELLKEIKKRE